MTDGLTIPDDLTACQTLIEQLAQTIGELNQKIIEKDQEIVEQKLTIEDLLRRAFAKRSERYVDDPNQFRLDFGDSPETEAAANTLAEALEESEKHEESGKPARRKPRKNTAKKRNEQFPDHLDRYEVIVEPEEDVKTCPEHGEKKIIRYDRVETLEFERPKLKVRVNLYPVYVCENFASCGVTQPPRTLGLVEGDRYSPSVAAEIIACKYGFHMPVYRQQDYFAGSGWTPGRSTLLNILEASANTLKPFTEYLREQVLACEILGTDETRVTLLFPPDIPPPGETAKSRRIHEVLTKARAAGKPSVSGRMWAYRSLELPLNVFDFTVSRHRDGPDDFLIDGGFCGKLIADCYSGYQGITLRSGARIERAACNAHARRKIFDAREHHPLLAGQFLAMFQELYDIEDRGRDLEIPERQILRETEARPVWERMRSLLDSPEVLQLLPKEAFTLALNYLKNQWDALQLYLTDGRLPIDNNEVEQLMKQVAIGRKNWLFIGSIAAGERAADLMTVVSSAWRNDLDIQVYVKDVLEQLLAGSTDYHSMRPDIWKQSHPEATREYRAEERRDRADAKRARRADRRADRRNG